MCVIFTEEYDKYNVVKIEEEASEKTRSKLMVNN